MVYDVKHDGRRKARLVAGGHLTETPIDSVYSKVVSLRGLKTVIFLAELNGLKLWATDIGNAYLCSKTKEKLHIIAGPEFGDKEGHMLIFHKACYGLKSSGLRWHEHLSDILMAMNFQPTRTEDDIWIRRIDDHYEYIARYVDDLAIASKQPEAIIKSLTETHKFKLKGTGEISYHLGCGYERDKDGTLKMTPSRYIDRMIENYVLMFGTKPKANVTSPLEKGDHPELDTTPELNEEDTKKYQSVIGALQWAVTIGRFDIATAVMSLSKFRASPVAGGPFTHHCPDDELYPVSMSGATMNHFGTILKFQTMSSKCRGNTLCCHYAIGFPDELDKPSQFGHLLDKDFGPVTDCRRWGKTFVRVAKGSERLGFICMHDAEEADVLVASEEWVWFPDQHKYGPKLV